MLKFLKKALILLICFKISQIDVVASNIINDNMLPPSYNDQDLINHIPAPSYDEVANGQQNITEEVECGVGISLEEIPTTIETSATTSTDEENQAQSNNTSNNEQETTAEINISETENTHRSNQTPNTLERFKDKAKRIGSAINYYTIGLLKRRPVESIFILLSTISIGLEIFMVIKTNNILKIRTSLDGVDTLKDFYYQVEESQSNYDYIANNAYKIINTFIAKANFIYLHKNFSLFCNHIETLMGNSIIPTTISKPIAFVLKHTLSAIPTLFSFNNILNTSAAGNQDKQLEKTYPFRQAHNASIALTVIKSITVIIFTSFFSQSDNLYDGEDILCPFLTQFVIDSLLLLTANMIRSLTFDKKFICDKSLKITYKWFADQHGNDCELFTEKLGMNNPEFDGIMAYSVLSSMVFIIPTISLVSLAFCLSYFWDEE